MDNYQPIVKPETALEKLLSFLHLALNEDNFVTIVSLGEVSNIRKIVNKFDNKLLDIFLKIVSEEIGFEIIAMEYLGGDPSNFFFPSIYFEISKNRVIKISAGMRAIIVDEYPCIKESSRNSLSLLEKDLSV